MSRPYVIGSLELQRDPNTPGGYNVVNWGRTIEPGGYATQTMPGSTTRRDVTNLIAIEYYGDGVPTYFQCETDNARNTRFTVTLEGSMVSQLGASPMVFSRIS